MGEKNRNTHLAENRLSSDFCDWSEVTDGLRWETWSHRDRDRVSSGDHVFILLLSEIKVLRNETLWCGWTFQDGRSAPECITLVGKRPPWCVHLPSVKPHRSQPLEEGVLHGEAPSSASVKRRDSCCQAPHALCPPRVRCCYGTKFQSLE